MSVDATPSRGSIVCGKTRTTDPSEESERREGGHMRTRFLSLALVAALGATATAPAAPKATRFEWTTKSADAKKKLLEVQQRIESFQFGAGTVEAARQLVSADPQFAMDVYYLSAVAPPPENEAHL